MQLVDFMWFRLFFVVTLALFFVGLTMPIMTVTQLFVFTNEVSIISGLVDLFYHGEYLLLAVVGLFSILFPLAKLIWIYLIWTKQNMASAPGMLEWLERLGKWSMLDVFVVAQLVVAVKLGLVAEIQLNWGLYAFCASVIGMILLTDRLKKLKAT